jgi:hypothetical protein
MVLVAVVAMAAVAVGAGCGGGGASDSESSGGSASSLSKAAFIRRASAACLDPREDTLEKVIAYQKRHQSDGVSQQVLSENAMKAAILSTVEAEIAALEKLGGPAGGEDQVEAIMAALRNAVKKGKSSAQAKVAQVEDNFKGADQMLRRYGIPACAKNG